jgi:branched-chain amino acid transport system substrate-binding protein
MIKLNPFKRRVSRRHGLFLIIIILLGLGMTACQKVVGPKTVKVAVTMPLGLEIGQDMLNAAQMALDEAGGKAGNIKVELLIFNSSEPEGNPVSTELEQQAVAQASDDPAVVAYIGAPTSDQARATLALLNEASITQLSPAATWPGLTKPGFGPGEPGVYYPTGRRHFFRLAPSDDVQGVGAARWAQKLGVESTYIVDDNSAYGRGVTGIFEVSVQDVGIKIIGAESFEGAAATTAELVAIANRVIEAEPDLLFIGSSIGFGGDEFIRTVRGLDPDINIMAPDGMVQDQLITDVGAGLVEGIYATSVTIPAEQLDPAAAFWVSYQVAYGKEPPPMAVATYEAMKVVLYAIEQAKEPTREGVLTAMANLGEFSGIMGTWQFDARGDISITAISGMQIKNGAWSFVQVIE